MNELEKSAEEYVKNRNYSDVNEGYSPGEVGFECEAAFKAGAKWQAKQSPWVRTADRMPEDGELVLTSSSIYETSLLVWDNCNGVWRDECGDAAYCEWSKIDAWMSIPE